MERKKPFYSPQVDGIMSLPRVVPVVPGFPVEAKIHPTAEYDQCVQDLLIAYLALDNCRLSPSGETGTGIAE